MGTRQLSLFLVGAQVKTAPLTMHLLLVFMVGTCAAMSVRKSPYVYQSNPMARMSMQARHHSGGNGWTSRSKNPFSYMVGKEFFKNEDIEGDHFEGPYEDLPYSVTQNYGNYEKRHYPEAVMACTYHLVDQAGDPLAGLENNNPYTIMMSRRFQKTPASIMFRRLFKYISGVNQKGQEIAMTRPVSTLHKVVREDSLGNLEALLMCFYLPSFDGFALTADTWESQRQILLDDLIGKKVKNDEFFCASYNSPMEMTNRRNEIWVQADEEDSANVSS